MRRIVLHVGTHKTGSTSIQKTLAHFRAELERVGIDLYPGSNHTDFYRAFTDTPQSFHQYYRGWRQRMRAESTRARIRRQMMTAPESIHLVSAEDISLLTVAGLRALYNFLRDDCDIDEIVVVCLLREPLDYLNSSLQQFVKPGLTALHDFIDDDFANYRLQGCPDFRGGMANILEQLYFPIPQRLVEVFGRDHVHFVHFGTAVSRGLTSSVLDHVLPGQSLPWLQELRYNEAMSHEACLLLAAYNEREPLLFHDGRLNKRRNREKHVVPLLRSIRGRKASLIDASRLDLRRINQCIAQVNAVVGSEIMIPLYSIPSHYAGTPLLEFSATALQHIAELVGEDSMPVPVADAVLEPDTLERMTQLLARRSMGCVRYFLHGLLRRLQ